ncbi:Uncharacterised protein [uncultured archaeon]|nr:Uncharacterised protein [uncultured archaeon]
MPAKKEIKPEEAIEFAKEETKTAMEMARAKCMECTDEIKKSIEKDPVKATMIAAGIGAAIGAAVTLAIMRKKKRDD